MPLSICTVNVNGIRAAARKGFLEWLSANEPDVLTLQEVRAPEGTVEALFHDGWNVVDERCDKPGRAGVSILTRHTIEASSVGLDDPAAGPSGRWAEVDLQTDDERGLTVVSSYCHTGEATDEQRMEEKHAYLRAAIARLNELAALGRHVVWTGDLNVAVAEVDLKNWKANRNKAGFLPEERRHFVDLMDKDGFIDVVRNLAGEGPGPYTWWTYRGRAYDNDAGWRLDYQFATPDLALGAKSFHIDRSMAWDQRWSDHAPVTVTYTVSLAG